MSTPGPERIPSTVKVDKTSGQGKPPAGPAKTGAKSTGAKSTGPKGGGKPGAGKGSGGKGRKPITPVKVNGARPWGPIAVISGVALVALLIIGFGVYGVIRGSRNWEDKVADIKGVVNYRAQKNPAIDARDHKDGALQYVTSPPVGGAHNGTPQSCNGNVYDAPIANEHAVHSLEHGAVWITYKQGLAADQVAVLKKKVEGQDYTLMSPYAGLDKNVSVQVWGYQLKTDDVNDARIDEFIKDTRLVSALEAGISCSGGNTTTGPVTAAATGAGTGTGN
jgi:hypothetical protein